MKPPKRISDKSKTQQTVDWFVKMGYAPAIDPEAIHRFINCTFSEEEACQKDKVQAAALLTALMEGTRAGDDISVELQRILNISKTRKRIFDPRTSGPGTQEWHVVALYILDEIRWVDAKATFMYEFGYEETTAERYIRELKPRVEEAIKANPQYYDNYLQN